MTGRMWYNRKNSFVLYLRATMRRQENEGSQEFVTAPGGGAQAALPAAGQKEADFTDSELRE